MSVERDVEFVDGEFTFTFQGSKIRLTVAQLENLHGYLLQQHPYEIIYGPPTRGMQDQTVVKRVGIRFVLRNSGLEHFVVVKAPSRLEQPYPLKRISGTGTNTDPDPFFVMFESKAKARIKALKGIQDHFSRLSTSTKEQTRRLAAACVGFKDVGINEKGLFGFANYENIKGVFYGVLAELISSTLATLDSSVRILENRKNLLKDYEKACKQTQKQLQYIENLKLSTTISSASVNLALEDLKEKKRFEEEKRLEMSLCTDLMRSSIKRYDEFHDRDVDYALGAYVKNQLSVNRQICEMLEKTISLV